MSELLEYETKTLRQHRWVFIAFRTVHNICRGTPRTPIDAARTIVAVLSQVLHTTQDTETVVEACWSLAYVGKKTALHENCFALMSCWHALCFGMLAWVCWSAGQVIR